jgi:glutaminyl-peptide cyclotransferase
MRTHLPRLGGLAALLALATLGGCQRHEKEHVPGGCGAGFDGARALAEVRAFVALGPRESGTTNALRAADYLVARLHKLNVAAAKQSFEDTVPGGTATFHNVVGKIPGTGPDVIILGAHYDTKRGIPGFVGANDSGSGVGALLEFARVLPPVWRGAPEIWLVFFDGEECQVAYGPHDGFHGSRRLAQQLVAAGRAHQVRAMILLDMIGDRDLTVTLPPNGTAALTSLALTAAEQLGVREKFSLAVGAIGDDHQAFLDAGMPAVDLIDFQFGSAPGLNDYWHTAADTPDKLSAASLQTIGRVVAHMLEKL